MKLALALFACTVIALPASAAGFYVSAYGGTNWDDVLASPIVETNTGSVMGLTVGTSVNAVPGLRLELDAAFRQNEVDIFGGAITADHDTTTLLVNAVYDIPLGLKVRPYVLAGVGYGHTQATFEDISLLRLEASGLAWQLGTGLNVTVADGVQLGVGYRYLQAPPIEVFGTELSDGTNHSVIAQVTFEF